MLLLCRAAHCHRRPLLSPPVVVQYVPSIYVLVSTVVIVGLRQWPALAFLYLGTYSSWVYLRFFQQQPESTACGDPSEDFAFSSFFPEFLTPPIDAVGTVLGRVTRLQHGDAGAGGEGKPLLPVVGAALGSNSADANRRRWGGWEQSKSDSAGSSCGQLLGCDFIDAVITAAGRGSIHR